MGSLREEIFTSLACSIHKLRRLATFPLAAISFCLCTEFSLVAISSSKAAERSAAERSRAGGRPSPPKLRLPLAVPGRLEEPELRGGVGDTEDSATYEELGRVEHVAELGRESGPMLCLRIGLRGKLEVLRVETRDSADSATDDSEELGRVEIAEVGRESGPMLCLRLGLLGSLWTMRVKDSDDATADEVLGRVPNAELGRESGPMLCLRVGL